MIYCGFYCTTTVTVQILKTFVVSPWRFILFFFNRHFDFRATSITDQPSWSMPLHFVASTPKPPDTLSTKDLPHQSICCLQQSWSWMRLIRGRGDSVHIAWMYVVPFKYGRYGTETASTVVSGDAESVGAQVYRLLFSYSLPFYCYFIFYLVPPR